MSLENNRRRDYYVKISQDNMTPLWESLHNLVPKQPTTPYLPYIWKYAQLRTTLMESGDLIGAKEAVRRVLIMENPGKRGSSSITSTLYAGLQLIMPGEIAPSHRHTQSALRFVVEGSGAYTAVDGERHVMEPGDFIITPSWTWHDHGNPGSEPVVWLDGLDIPIIRTLDAGFAENFPEEVQPLSKADGDAFTRFGNNMVPLDYESKSKTSPIFAYPYANARAVLHTLMSTQNADPVHGYKMQYINPITGGYPMPTMATFLQMYGANFESQLYRSTDATVFSVVEGCGIVEIEGDDSPTILEFSEKDHFIIPSWKQYKIKTNKETVLFSFSDRPIQKVLGVWREERI
jgi:gentisate 1,2-dioxygenase